MKKIFSLLAIATIVATTLTSCKDDKPGPPPGPDPIQKPKLTLSVDKLTLEAGDTGKFTVTADISPLNAIVIAVASDDTKILTVDPASVTIAKDGKKIEGTYTAVADGKTKITITTTTANVSLATGSVEVTVGKEVELPEGEIVTADLLCDKDNVWSENWFADFKIGDTGSTMGFTLWFNNTVNLENGGCDYVGTDLNLTAVDKGTDISTLTFKQNSDHELMGVNGGTGYEILPLFTNIDGEKYIVFCVPKDIVPIIEDDIIQNTDECTHDKPQVKGWALVSVSDNGNTVTLKTLKFPASKVGE